MFHPDDDNGDVLRRLEAEGDDLSRPRDIDFNVVFPDEAKAKEFAQQFQRAGYRTTVRLAEVVKTHPWEVLVVKNMIPTYAGITDFEEQNKALKAGNPKRLVSFNDWVRPRLTDFQDVQFGEAFNGLNDGAGKLFPNGPPIGGNGIYLQGPHKGLQAHGMFILDGAGYGWEWGIWKPDTAISKPRWTNDQIAEMAKHAKSRNLALTFNLLMYEDGTVSSESLAAVRLFRDTLRRQD